MTSLTSLPAGEDDGLHNRDSFPTRAPGSAAVGAPGVVLHPAEFATRLRLTQAPGAPSVRRWVDKYWSVTWDLPAGVDHRSSTAPPPAINLTYEYGGVSRDGVVRPGWYVTGVISDRRFDVRQYGIGGVIGIRFRPGAFTTLTGLAAHLLRNKVIPADEVLPGELLAEPPAAALDSAESASAHLDALVEAMTRAACPEPDLGSDPELDRLEAALAVMADEHTLEVATLAEACGVSVRTLQRIFRRLVGVGPKWMLARARLHDAIARLDAGYAGPLADLATDLGWFDQAHFTRDFTALVGVPPSDYRPAPP